MSKKLKKHVAEKYIESAIVQKEIINRLMERLSFINLSPRKVADLGSGVGLSTESLLKLHPNSEFYMMDYSFKSLNSNILQNKSVNSVCANFKNIPFENNTFEINGIKKLINGIVYKNAITQPKKYNSVLLLE